MKKFFWKHNDGVNEVHYITTIDPAILQSYQKDNIEEQSEEECIIKVFSNLDGVVSATQTVTFSVL